jgi:hypothetical protein
MLIYKRLSGILQCGPYPIALKISSLSKSLLVMQRSVSYSLNLDINNDENYEYSSLIVSLIRFTVFFELLWPRIIVVV